MSNFADIAVALGDYDLAARTLSLLEPYAGQCQAVAGMCHGSVSRTIARLHALLGHDELADAAFAQALEHNRRLHAPFHIAYTELDHAEALAARGQPVSGAVEELTRSALNAARTYRFGGLEQRALAVLAYNATT
jgi:ATP/maltotriose-dependent transcriptional regulator MalT